MVAAAPIAPILPNASQSALLSCPAFEVLLQGNRGGGKTWGLFADYAQDIGVGHGPAWRGVLFRRQFKDLITDLIPKSIAFFRPLFPDAEFVQGNSPEWRFPGGEVLMFRHIKDERGYWDYHGSEIPWIAWEELTSWASPGAYLAMMTCCRSSRSGMPRKYRATTNPFGVGHNWVKQRFIDAAPERVIVRDDESERGRAHIRCSLAENRHLVENDPEYIENLKAQSDPAKRAAWLEGDWDIVAGGMFDDVWDRRRHVIPAFALHGLPKGWRIDRSFDWGSTRPFSVLWWTEADGSEWIDAPDDRLRHLPKGSLVLIAQWYGSNGRPNEGLRLPDIEIARGIVRREREMGIDKRVKPGPADNQIFNKSNNGDSIADVMIRGGVRWTASDKSPGSRIQGVQLLRGRLANAKPKQIEEPCLFVLDSCKEWLRAVPVLPRDERNPEDVDTEAEDHDFDGTRYRLLQKKREMRAVAVAGLG